MVPAFMMTPGRIVAFGDIQCRSFGFEGEAQSSTSPSFGPCACRGICPVVVIGPAT